MAPFNDRMLQNNERSNDNLKAQWFLFFYLLDIFPLSSWKLCLKLVIHKSYFKSTFDLIQQDLNAELLAMVKMTALVIGSFLVLYTPAVSLFILGFVGIQVPLWFNHLAAFALLMQGVTNSAVYCFRHEIFKQELKQFYCFGQTSRGRSQTAASSSSGLSNLSYEKWSPSASHTTNYSYNNC